MQKIVVSLCFLIFASLAFSQSDLIVDGIHYYVPRTGSNTLTVKSNAGSYSGHLTIPSTVTYLGQVCRVTSIGWSAFYNCTSLESITLPPTVTSIGVGAFSGCTSLVSISIPSSVIFIDEDAFSGCTSLDSISIPYSVISIGVSSFKGCSAFIQVDSTSLRYSSKDGVLYNKNDTTLMYCPTSLEDGFTIPYTVRKIEKYAFYGCSKLTSIEIPSSVTTIGSYAFYGCTGLTFLEIPPAVQAIGDKAFFGCTGLTTMIIPPSVKTLGWAVFTGCTALINVESSNINYASKDGVLYSKNFSTLIHCPTSIKNRFTIPSTVNTIGNSAFFDCKDLTSILIPASVTSIEWYVFAGCTSLESITSYITAPTNLDAYNTLYGVDTLNWKLYIPFGTRSLYTAASGWKEFHNIIEFDATDVKTIDSESIKFYSNPTSSTIHLALDETMKSPILKIYNTSGQKWYEMRASDNQIQIDVSSYPTGVYFILSTDQNHQIKYIGKFLK